MKTIETKNAPAAIGPYSQAKVVGNLVYCSGQLPVDPTTNLIILRATIISWFILFLVQGKFMERIPLKRTEALAKAEKEEKGFEVYLQKETGISFPVSFCTGQECFFETSRQCKHRA